MTEAELVAQIAKQTDLTQKTTEAALESIIGAIHDSLKKAGEIRIDGLGTFKVTERKARTGVNPRTKEVFGPFILDHPFLYRYRGWKP